MAVPRRSRPVDEDAAQHLTQPRPRGPVVLEQAGKVTPGAQEGLLQRVLGCHPVMGEVLGVGQQRAGVVPVESSQGVVGAGGQWLSGHGCIGHVY